MARMPGASACPVVLLTGDDQLRAQCMPHFPAAEIVVVKQALGQRAARALSPETARTRIRASAEQAMRRIGEARPFLVAPPYRLEIDLNSVALADLAATIPVAERLDSRTVGFDAGSAAAAIGWVNTISAMSSALR
jgi:D-amino peptidase